MSGKWQFWIDRGGTFTDIVARRPDGAIVTKKLLSADRERYDDAATHGIGLLLGTPPGVAPDPALIGSVKMGTTVATNALLERAGERTALAITEGFGDAIRIGYQNRPKLFDRRIVLPDMLYDRVVEIPERVIADGSVRRRIDLDGCRSSLADCLADGCTAIAIVLMHGYRYPAHEIELASLARSIGFTQVSVSHQVSPLMKLVGRGDTTLADAYLTPLLRRYVDTVSTTLAGSRLMFMQSNGGLADAAEFEGKDAVLSGPAGGVIGAATTAREAGFERIIGFDMGGTSTDVSHYAGAYERTIETVVAGVRMRTPMLQINTVAAGGGSICSFRGGRFRVGPESAGADPGPACYRRGGPLTVTDCNLVLGRVQAAHFPAVFGDTGTAPLDRAAAATRLEAVSAEIEAETGRRRNAQEIAEGFLDIAVANMANAIKQVSVQRGYDVSGYALACFGGAGGQHACRVADSLGMATVLIHPLAGVLSAYGIGRADLTLLRQAALELPLDEPSWPRLADQVDALEQAARQAFDRQYLGSESLQAIRRLHVKYAGTDTTLTVAWAAPADAVAAFATAHRQRYGFVMQERPLIVESAEVELVGAMPADPVPSPGTSLPDAPPQPLEQVEMAVGARVSRVPLFDRAKLRSGHSFDGPALIVDANGTTVIESGWSCRIDLLGNMILSRTTLLPARAAIGTDADPVLIELFNNLFMSIAEQMGEVLRNTAHSVNIKERLDFSCALFDDGAALVANAPHMPVHLGSMGESVATIIRLRGTARDGRGMARGDVYALNAPYNGGTHLPDVTVIMPVFADDDQILFYVAARGHQADIGGLTPGSMPPGSRTVEEEGILIDNLLLVDQGMFREAELLGLLGAGPYPARNPAQNVADLKAQIAACEKGATELRRMVETYGLTTVRAYMGHVQDNAEEAVRRVVARLGSGHFRYEMDQGTVIEVDIKIDRKRRSAIIDFAGTSPQQPDNFNAPSAICRAAVLYVFRTLVDDDIPMNEGCLKPLEIRIPSNSMLSPTYPSAVVAGNVETSQCITDALYGALGVMAASQGTMNNFTFGDEKYQYYETICGGSGAGANYDGVDAVHTHMTNSRLTDPEVLEWRYPVLVDEFRIRRGSGGEGAYHGGDGVVRRIRFLRPMTAAILSNRRRIPPYGMAGGATGKPGCNKVERAAGGIDLLASTEQISLLADDVFVIETPGGGGYGVA